MQRRNYPFARIGAATVLALSLGLFACGGSSEQSSASNSDATQTQQVDDSSSASTTAQTGTASQDTDERLDKLVLVNKTHALPAGWEDNLQLVSTTNSKGETVSIDTMANDPFLELQSYLAQQGITIELNSGYRSIADQQAIVDQFTVEYGEEYVREFVAEPGHSEHHTGIAFDVFLTEDGVPILTNEEIYAHQSTWDVIHAALPKFGFILRYPDGKEDITGYTYEPWHYRYVGVDAAQDIYQRGITLEEYLGEV